MSYEAWRITFQSSEQAARAAFTQVNEQAAKIEALEAERAALAKQEPVAWYVDDEEGREYNGTPQMSDGRNGIPLYAHPVPAEQLVNERLRDSLRGLLSHFPAPSRACKERPAYEDAVSALAAAEAQRFDFPVLMTILVTQPHGTYWTARRIADGTDMVFTDETPMGAVMKTFGQAPVQCAPPMDKAGPVRLTDDEIETIKRRAKNSDERKGVKGQLTAGRAIEIATLRANGFQVEN